MYTDQDVATLIIEISGSTSERVETIFSTVFND